MSQTIEIAGVLDQVAFRLHLPAVGTGAFVTTASALLLAKSSVSRLGALLNRSFGDAYFAQTATLATQAELDLVSLPSGFKDLLSLHWVDGTEAHLLERASVTEYSATPVAWGNSVLPKYRVEGNVLVLTPPPLEVYSLRCAYTTGLGITALSDSIQGQAGWEEWLVLDICEQIRDREDKDASKFTFRKVGADGKGGVQGEILSQASQRDRNGVTTVRDVRNELETCADRGWHDFGWL